MSFFALFFVFNLCILSFLEWVWQICVNSWLLWLQCLKSINQSRDPTRQAGLVNLKIWVMNRWKLQNTPFTDSKRIRKCVCVFQGGFGWQHCHNIHNRLGKCNEVKCHNIQHRSASLHFWQQHVSLCVLADFVYSVCLYSVWEGGSCQENDTSCHQYHIVTCYFYLPSDGAAWRLETWRTLEWQSRQNMSQESSSYVCLVFSSSSFFSFSPLTFCLCCILGHL